jgi:RND family efflux transporter MFP subunit
LGQALTEDLQTTVREVGVVDPASKVDVKAAVSGRVMAMRVREGDVVRRGQVLAEIEPDVTQAQSLASVQARVSSAKVKLRHAERDLEQMEVLFREGIVPEQKYRTAKMERDLALEDLGAAQADFQIAEDRGIPIRGGPSTQAARVTAPMDGVVIHKGAEPGDTITSGVSSFNAGTVLFIVADLKSLIIKVNLNEVDIAKVRAGQEAVITLDAYPQRTFRGLVRFVAPAAEEVDKLKVFKVELALDCQDDAFRTGMTVNVEILGERRAGALSVPLEALQRRDGRTVVYRLRPNLAPKALASAREGLAGRFKSVWLSEHWQGYFESVPVEGGLATLERVEIRTGLALGDQVSLEDPTRRRVETDDNAI